MIEINNTIAPFTLSDQFGKTHTIESMPKLLICSFQKSTGTLITDYFNSRGESYLDEHDITLLADVSSVPTLLRKTIIIPKMKKYNFEILLSTDETFTQQFPQKEENLTILKIENNILKDILYVTTADSLKGVIEG